MQAKEEQRFPMEACSAKPQGLNNHGGPSRVVHRQKGPALEQGGFPRPCRQLPRTIPEVSSTSSKKLTTVSLLLATASQVKVAILHVNSPLRVRIRMESLKEDHCRVAGASRWEARLVSLTTCIVS